MKKISTLLALGFVLSAPSTSVAAPKSGAQFPNTKMPVPTAKAKPKAKSNNKGTTNVGAGTHSGVVKSILVGKNGQIIELYMKISGSVHTQRIKGCGAKSAAHPLLTWVFQQQRLVHITSDGSGCMSNVLIPR